MIEKGDKKQQRGCGMGETFNEWRERMLAEGEDTGPGHYDWDPEDPDQDFGWNYDFAERTKPPGEDEVAPDEQVEGRLVIGPVDGVEFLRQQYIDNKGPAMTPLITPDWMDSGNDGAAVADVVARLPDLGEPGGAAPPAFEPSLQESVIAGVWAAVALAQEVPTRSSREEKPKEPLPPEGLSLTADPGSGAVGVQFHSRF
jgi:hypothetical protein